MAYYVSGIVLRTLFGFSHSVLTPRLGVVRTPSSFFSSFILNNLIFTYLKFHIYKEKEINSVTWPTSWSSECDSLYSLTSELVPNYCAD